MSIKNRTERKFSEKLNNSGIGYKSKREISSMANDSLKSAISEVKVIHIFNIRNRSI